MRRSYYPSINVRVQQQPQTAADAARLYGEIKNKAIADAQQEFIFATVKAFGVANELRITNVEVIPVLMNDQKLARFVFSLNDRQYDITLDATEAIEERFSREVAGDLLIRLAAEIRSKWR